VHTGQPVVYELGGFAPPLGVALRADAMAVAMLVAVGVVILGIATYALAEFRVPDDPAQARAALTYWLLILAIGGSTAVYSRAAAVHLPRRKTGWTSYCIPKEHDS
jgi:formate hydrogenlyase subunit 3/multisubunit Na+/H+ antiporter MnhD subunit